MSIRRDTRLIERHIATLAEERGVARERVRFSRRELREGLGWGDTQLKVHLARLASLELVWCHRGPHGAYLYELAWNGESTEDGAPRLAGLIDPEQLDAHAYDHDRSGPGRPPVGGRSVPGRALAVVGG